MTIPRSLPSVVTCLAITAIAVVYVRDAMRAKPAPAPTKAAPAVAKPAPPPAPPPLPVAADLADVAAAYHGAAADRLGDLAQSLGGGTRGTRAEVEALWEAEERPWRYARDRALDEACDPDGTVRRPAELAAALDRAARAIRAAK